MNNKILTSIVTLGIIATSAANAITRNQCNNSDKTVWVENVVNADGSRGACVPKNTCVTETFKEKYCNTIFKDIQVIDLEYATRLIRLYLYKNYDFHENVQFDYFDANNTVGQDYIGAKFGGEYLTFEFDDTNDISNDDLKKGLCLAVGGGLLQCSYEHCECQLVSSKDCALIDGNYYESSVNGFYYESIGICSY